MLDRPPRPPSTLPGASPPSYSRCTTRSPGSVAASASATSLRWQCSGCGLAAEEAGTPPQQLRGRTAHTAPRCLHDAAESPVRRPPTIPPRFLKASNRSCVGASSGTCTYSMPASSRANQARSSRLANPASCERLCRADVDQGLHARGAQQFEEGLGALPRESESCRSRCIAASLPLPTTRREFYCPTLPPARVSFPGDGETHEASLAAQVRPLHGPLPPRARTT